MPETYDHILECKHIYNQFNEYKKRTLELIREALKKRCSDNKTPFTDSHEDMITMSTNQFFHHDADQRDYNPQRFLSSLEAKWITTPQSNRSFHERANLINKSSGSWLYITTVASCRALCEIWWKPRTKLIYKEQRLEIKAIKIKSALEKKTKRDEKRECAKSKREQTMQKLMENRAAKHKQKEDIS
jgi:hypothetical protein